MIEPGQVIVALLLLVALATVIWMLLRAFRQKAVRIADRWVSQADNPSRFAIQRLRLMAALPLLGSLVVMILSPPDGGSIAVPRTLFFASLATIALTAPAEGLRHDRLNWRNGEIIRAETPVWFWSWVLVATLCGLVAAALAIASALGLLS